MPQVSFVRPILYVIDASNKERIYLNPKEPKSITLCRSCWNELDDSRAYCRRCGTEGSIFSVDDVSMSSNCHIHKTKAAVGVCCYCNQPVCEICCKSSKGGWPVLFQDLYYCYECLKDIDYLQHKSKQFPKTQFCFRHQDISQKYRCTECGEPTCEFCTYYPVTGIFRKRVVQEPYCPNCIIGILTKKFRHCILDYFKNSDSIKKIMF